MNIIFRTVAATAAPRGRRIMWVACALVTAVGASSCSDLASVAPYSPETDGGQLFMDLRIDHRAVNLALADGYRELQLTATPLNAMGEPMAGLPAPSFRSSDTTRVKVTQSGLLQARRASNKVMVVAEIVAPGNIRRADTIYVNVTDTPTPPVLDLLTVAPEDPAGLVMGMMPPVTAQFGLFQMVLAGRSDLFPLLALRALGADGNPIPGLVVEYEALDPGILYVHPRAGSLKFYQPGEARIVVRTTAYGVTKADTTRFTVTPPAVNGARVDPGANGTTPRIVGRTIRIRPGGYAFFTNLTTDSLRVTFENPAAAGQIPELCAALGSAYPSLCDAGDIMKVGGGTPSGGSAGLILQSARGRRFTEPGEYPYRIEPLGITGTVFVSDEMP